MGIDITQWRVEIAKYWKFAGRKRHSRGKLQGVNTVTVITYNPILALLLTFCLITAPSLLLQAGDVERNPGPPKEQSTQLSINDLGTIQEAVLDASIKWYDFGLSLCDVPVCTLDKIKSQFDDQSERLRETLKEWLKNATKPTWQVIVDALRTRTVGEANLACKIEGMYCRMSETGTSRPATQQELQTEFQDSQRQNQELVHQVQLQQQTIDDKDKQLQALKENVLQCEQTIRELQDQLKQALQQAVEKKQEARERQSQEHNQQVQKTKKVAAQAQQYLQKDSNWVTDSIPAPETMFRGSTVTTSDGSMAYFNDYNSNAVYAYDSKKQWTILPNLPCKHTFPTLVIVQNVLTTVGGKFENKATNTLFSLVQEGREKKWKERFCKMPSKRWLSAAVFSGKSLIVAGGRNDHAILRTVEVLDTNTLQWSIAGSLKQPVHYATMSICGNNLYHLGGWKEMNERTCEVLTCSIYELLQTCIQPSVAGNISVNKSIVWHSVDNAPYYDSTCATLGGELISVGGMDKDGKETTNISTYDEKSNFWTTISNLPTARRLALVAILHEKIMVVGGWSGGNYGGQKLDIVELETGLLT